MNVDNKLKKILVFGGTGFFGSNFIKLLVKTAGVQIVCVTRNAILEKNLPPNIYCVSYDEVNLADPKFSYIDYVIDFAASVSVESFVNFPQEMFLKNIMILSKNLSFIDKVDFTGRYFFISSDRALLSNDINSHGNDGKIYNDPYGASKLINKLIAEYCGFASGFDVTTIIFPNIYGPAQKSAQLIPYIMRCLQKKQTKIHIGSKSGNRNFLHIDDASRALAAVILKPRDSREIKFSGNNENIASILKLIASFAKLEIGLDVKFIEKSGTKPRLRFNTPPESLDDTQDRKFYNWLPLINIEEGLKMTVRSYLGND